MHKKAFTLMELLIVVLVIGVLASVAIPKFIRVVETRRTNEAEDMLSAVRTEQEKRCIMGNSYLGEDRREELVSLNTANKSPNYTYNLLSNGVEAQREDNYTLKMFYKTGTFCCEGSGCGKLNKDYPSCDSISEPDDECVGDPPPPPFEGGCTGEKPEDQYVSCGACREQWLIYSCHAESGQWRPYPTGCVLKEGFSDECSTPGMTKTEECTVGSKTGTRTLTCSNKCGWIVGECQVPKVPKDPTCPNGYKYIESSKKCCMEAYKVNTTPSSWAWNGDLSNCKTPDLTKIYLQGAPHCEDLGACPHAQCSTKSQGLVVEFTAPGSNVVKKVPFGSLTCKHYDEFGNKRWVYQEGGITYTSINTTWSKHLVQDCELYYPSCKDPT